MWSSPKQNSEYTMQRECCARFTSVSNHLISGYYNKWGKLILKRIVFFGKVTLICVFIQIIIAVTTLILETHIIKIIMTFVSGLVGGILNISEIFNPATQTLSLEYIRKYWTMYTIIVVVVVDFGI